MHYLLFFLLIINSLFCADIHFQAHVPKTAYIQWLQSPGQSMSQAQDSHIQFSLSPWREDSRDLYLGVMCNSLTGYRISFTASEATGPTTADALSVTGNRIPYSVELRPMASTFKSPKSQSTTLNLQGSTPSLSVSFASSGDLPLRPEQRNIWRLTAKLLTHAIDMDEYYAGITVIISLP